MGIKKFTNLDNYYDDESQFGEYQYTSLKEVVNNFMLDLDDESHLNNVDRNRVVMHAKKGVRELYFDVVNEVTRIELDLNPQLTIPLPHDYISYVRIAWVDLSGRLHPLAVDNSLNMARAYLQDNDYEYLYDMDGDILQGSHVQNLPENDKRTMLTDSDGLSNLESAPFNLDRSKVFKNGSFRIDKEIGEIQFSSAVEGRTIVLEYISDGLFQREDSEIKIHKFAERALDDYIFFNLIRRSKVAPERAIMRAERAWNNSKRRAKRRLSPITLDNVRQALKGSSKWIKD